MGNNPGSCIKLAICLQNKMQRGKVKPKIKPTKITHNIYDRSHAELDTVDYTNRHYQRETMLANRYRFDAVVDVIK